jgi:hypothetical protein
MTFAGFTKTTGFMVLALFLQCEGPLSAQIVSGDQAYYSKEGDSIRLGNRFLELRFSARNGELQALIQKKSGVDLKKEKTDCYHTIWGLGVFTPQKTRSWTDNARSARFFQSGSVRAERTGQELKLQLVWNGICLDNGTDYPATVQTTISVYDGSPFSIWRISVQNRGQSAIEKVDYPFIAGVQELGPDGSDDCLVVPTLEGRLYHDPTRNLEGAGNTYPSCFLNMQFAAYYDNNAGFYTACYDNQGYVKRFSYGKPGGRWATMFWEHYGEGIKYGADFAVPYPVTVGVFQGDWYTAADIYRQWATNQWWANKKIRQKNTPAWVSRLGESSCFVRSGHLARNGKPLADIAAGARNHHNYFDTPLLIQLWGWENQGAWAYGAYFPPMEGWTNFDKLVTSLHADGCRLNTFLGASCIDEQSDLWKSQAPLYVAVRDESGKLREGTDPNADLKTATMCFSTRYWQAKMEDFVLPLINHQVDMIQFDGFPPVPSTSACYDSAHGHPLGMGRWMTDDWRQTVARIIRKARIANPESAFTAEGISEDLIPLMDVAKYWRDVCSEVGASERGFEKGTTEIIPLFNDVYHEFILGMEEQVSGANTLRLSLSKLREYNHYCLGRMLIWGVIPLFWAEDPADSPGTDKEAFDLVRRVANARTTYAQDFLVYGRMQPPLKFSAPMISVPVYNWAGASHPRYQMQVPAVMHSVWRADDGSVGAVFVNIAKEPVSIGLSLDFRQWGLRPGAKPFLYCVKDGKHSLLKGDSNSTANLDVAIQPLEIVFIGLCESSGPRAQQVLGQINAGESPHH